MSRPAGGTYGRHLHFQNLIDSRGDLIAVFVAILPMDIQHDRPAEEIERMRMHVFRIARLFAWRQRAPGEPIGRDVLPDDYRRTSAPFGFSDS